MNVGKAVASIIAVVAIVVCCYSSFAAAIPTDLNMPFELATTEGSAFETTVTDMEVTVKTPEFSLTSHLPQDIDDVKIVLYLGAGDKKVYLGELDFDKIASEQKITRQGEFKIPVFAALATMMNPLEKDGVMSIPLAMKLSFKYFDWQDTHLIDMGTTVISRITMEGGAISTTVDGNNASVSASYSSGVIQGIAQQMISEGYDNVTLKCGDAAFAVSLTSGSSTGVKFDMTGTSDANAAEILKSLLNENGELEFEYQAGSDAGTFKTDESQSQAVINLLGGIYAGAEA